MSIVLRCFLLFSAAVVFLLAIRKIKSSEFHPKDAIFWLIVCGLLVLVALVPQIAFICSDALGFESPANFVFLGMIAILLIRLFSLSTTVATLQNKLNRFVETFALDRKSGAEDEGR